VPRNKQTPSDTASLAERGPYCKNGQMLGVSVLSNSVPDLYRALIESHRAAAEACFADPDALAAFTRAHNFLGDLSVLREILKDRSEVACFDVAAQEYQYSLSAVISGHYRHAFSSLRLSFELLLSSIYFSAHEVKLRQWLNGSRDITWSGLTDDDKGVFSAPFVKAFHPEMVELRRRFGGIAASVYRECSEFVHGNPKTHNGLAGEVRLRKDVLLEWSERAESIRLIILYCYFYRYAAVCGEREKEGWEPLMLDAFGHEAAVQQYFQKA
jgi:hypothetical protein